MVHVSRVSRVLRPMTQPLAQWAERSQQHACRNAMVASTTIAETLRERDEVQEYVDVLLAHRSRRAGSPSPDLPATRLG